MCNVYNTCGCNLCGYATSSAQSAGNGSCGCWNGCWQRVCRDACGNLIVRNASSGCANFCGCSCGCGCGAGNTAGNSTTTGNNGNTVSNGNGVFRCVTYCGYGNTAVRGRSGCNCASQYYAQQYGLNCDDSGECTYSFTND